MNEDELKNWYSVRYRMREEGMDYCFEHYSNWDEIKDEEFHRLRMSFLQNMRELESYVNRRIEDGEWDGNE